jgi:hypothetical protein
VLLSGAIDWNPLNWQSWPFVAVIIICLLFRFVLPTPRTSSQRFVAELLLLLPAILLYFIVRGLVDARAGDAINNAYKVVNLERRLGIFVELDLQEIVLQSATIQTIVNWIYIWMHWPVVIITIIWLITQRPRARYGVYLNAFLLSAAIGMVIFALFPVAPPRLVPSLGLEDTVTRHSHSYRVLQPPGLTNPFAAMPSLHFGWNLLVGIAIVREARHPLARAFGVVMPAMMFSAIVLTANHYILDGLVGGTLTTVCLLIAMHLPQDGARWLTWRGLTGRERA